MAPNATSATPRYVAESATPEYRVVSQTPEYVATFEGQYPAGSAETFAILWPGGDRILWPGGDVIAWPS